MTDKLIISQEVQAALQESRPIVALESTVIAHGLPRPTNLETALELESIVRETGATPATIAIIGGQMRVGLSHEELEHLANADNILKLGSRDLPMAVSTGKDGATTVSATAFIASRIGIPVFVTGGIGGVHRGANRSFDISSDLWELAHSNILVVCAGAKSILDLPATLEWLETHLVPVIGYQTDEFPAFYSRHSGLKIDRTEFPEEIAARYSALRGLGMQSGMLVGVPIPQEDELQVEDTISSAVAEAENLGISGKEVTPWILARMYELTGGRSVTANIALLKNNARVGSEIALALTGSRRTDRGEGSFV